MQTACLLWTADQIPVQVKPSHNQESQQAPVRLPAPNSLQQFVLTGRMLSSEVDSGVRTPHVGHHYRLPATFGNLKPTGIPPGNRTAACYHPKCIASFILYIQTSDDVQMIPLEETGSDGAHLGGFLERIAPYLPWMEKYQLQHAFTLQTATDTGVCKATILPKDNAVAQIELMHFLYALVDEDVVWLHLLNTVPADSRTVLTPSTGHIM
jgi:hypothetical protein